MSTPDFWGEIPQARIRTPVSILREQASLLGAKTRNQIEAKVVTVNANGRFYHTMNLSVPALDNYQYSLLSANHTIELYPVMVQEGSVLRTLRDEEQFVQWLRAKLSSPETKRIIEALLAQVENP